MPSAAVGVLGVGMNALDGRAWLEDSMEKEEEERGEE